MHQFKYEGSRKKYIHAELENTIIILNVDLLPARLWVMRQMRQTN